MHTSHAHEHTPETPDLVIHWASRYDRLLRLGLLGQERALRASTLEPAHIQPGDRVLDVGCGPGSLTLVAKSLAGPTGEVHGIDASPEMIDLARRKALKAGVDADFQVALIQDIPFADGHFDVVTSSFMMHHLADDDARRKGLAEICRVLKPGGRCLIIDFEPPSNPLLKHLFGGHRMMRVDNRQVIPIMEEAGFQDVEWGKPHSWISIMTSFVIGRAPLG